MSGKKGQRTTKHLKVANPFQKTRNILDSLDARYRPYREMKARYGALVSDLGGESELTYARKSLLWRFVCLENWIEDRERDMVLARPFDEAKWLTALGVYQGLLKRVGLVRCAKPVRGLAELLTINKDDGNDAS